MRLDTQQIERALHVLEREQVNLSLSPTQQHVQSVARALAVLCAGALVSFVGATRVPALHASPLLPALLYCGIIAGTLAVVLSAVNVRAFRKTWRHVRLLRKLGRSEVSAMRALVTGHPSTRLVRFSDVVMALGATTIGLLMLGFHNWVTTIFGLILIAVIVAIQLTSRARMRVASLADVERLRQLMEGQHGEPPSIDDASLQQIAEIERAQITEQRARAIDRQDPQRSREYTVLKSTAAVAALNVLPVEDRLRVEEAIEDLCSSSPDTASGRDADTVAVVDVADTPIRFSYSVDDQGHVVKILEVARRDEVAPSGGPR